MLRMLFGAVAVLSLSAMTLFAADDKPTAAKDKNSKDEPQKATITKINPKTGELTVKMKNKEGKEVERTFKLTEDVRYFDSTGKAALIDVFRSGNYVLVVEHEGKIKELRQDKDQGKVPADKKPTDK